MMVTQAFLYNAIFFTYALVLTEVLRARTSPASRYYFFPFAIGNLLGPLLLGHLFDTIGRRKMILGTYAVAGVVLLHLRVAVQRRRADRRDADRSSGA